MVALDDLSGGFSDNVASEAEFVEGSVVNSDLIESLFATRQFDYVFHLAAYAAEGLSHYIRRFNCTNNVIGSMNLINQAVIHAAARFVFTSSMRSTGSVSST